MKTLQNPVSLVNLLKDLERITGLVRELVENRRAMNRFLRTTNNSTTTASLSDAGDNAD